MAVGFEGGFGEIASILFGGTFDRPINVLILLHLTDGGRQSYQMM